MTLHYAALVTALVLPAVLSSQEPSACPKHVSIPGSSNSGDAPMHRCRLTNKPSLQTSLDRFPVPMYAQSAGSTLTVMVNATGRINEEFTRYWLVSGDDDFHRRFMDALRSAEFNVGRDDSSPTAYGFRLVVETGVRVDTIPQKLVWRYVRGVAGDSLVGEWRRTGPEPPHTAAQMKNVMRQVTQTLRQMQVLLPTQQYCVLTENAAARDAIVQELYANARRRDWVGRRVSHAPCEADVSNRRYLVGNPIRTGGGRTVVRASGDLLRNWPPGLDGRQWLTWEAYCVVPEAGSLVGRPQCNVTPIYTGDASIEGGKPRLFSDDTTQKAPLQIAVEVTTVGSYWNDTIKASALEVPTFENGAAMLHDVNLCRESETWTMLADSITGNEWIAWLKFSGGRAIPGSLRLDRVRKRALSYSFEGCASSPSNVSIAAFLLGSLGERPASPVVFCHNVSGCRQRVIIDPSKHMLAARPVLSFKFTELRPEAMAGEQYLLRLHTNRDAAGLIPFIVLRHDTNASAFELARRSGRQYDFRVTHTPPFPKDAVVDVYLATAGRRAVVVPQ